MTSNITVKVSYSWWVQPYLQTLIFLCNLFGAEVNESKVINTVTKGMKIN